jgi:hypothetical protein
MQMDLKKTTRFVLKHQIPVGTSGFYYIALLVIAIITVYPWFNTGLACGDDMANYLITRFGKVFANAKDLAELHGRFQYLFTLPIGSLPFIWDNMFVIKLFQVVPIMISLYLFYRIMVASTGSKELSALYALLFLITAQVSRHTSLFVTYPFFFSFSLSILLLSYLMLMRFQRKKKLWMLVASALIFSVGVLFFEAYLLYFGFASLLIIYSNIKSGTRGMTLVKNTALQILPFFIVVVCYIIVYVLYSRAHPSQYDGNKMADSAAIMKSFFTVLWRLSYTAFPLTVYDTTRNLFASKSEILSGFHNVVPYLMGHARVEWIVKGILVFGVSYYLLVRIPRIAWSTIILGVVVALLLTFFPHIPLALTVKYIFYTTTQNMLGYVTTFFSLFGVVLFLSMITALVLNLTGNFTIFRHLTALLISVAFVFCGFLTDFSNYYVTRDVDRASTRLYAMDELMKSEKFTEIPQSSNMYGFDLWNNPSTQASGLTVQNFEWTYYIGAKSGMAQYVYYNDSVYLSKAKQTPAPGYRIMYNQGYKSDDALLAIAQLKQPGPDDKKVDTVSTKIVVLYYSKDKYFSVSFRKQATPGETKTPIHISHIADETDPGEYVEFAIYNTKENQRATVFVIEGPAVIIKSIHISNLVSPGMKIYYL